MNVGLFAIWSQLKDSAIPLTSVVFPAPKFPSRKIIFPLPIYFEIFLPILIVSDGAIGY